MEERQSKSKRYSQERRLPYSYLNQHTHQRLLDVRHLFPPFSVPLYPAPRDKTSFFRLFSEVLGSPLSTKSPQHTYSSSLWNSLMINLSMSTLFPSPLLLHSTLQNPLTPKDPSSPTPSFSSSTHNS